MIQNVKRILAPIDFSEYSMDALDGAWELARDVGADLHVVHVVAPVFTIIERSRELAREAAGVEQGEEELERLHKDKFGKSAKVTTKVMVGAPATKLIEYAGENNIDLIMLATHGRTAEHLIGGTTEKIARTAPCSVLVLRRLLPNRD